MGSTRPSLAAFESFQGIIQTSLLERRATERAETLLRERPMNQRNGGRSLPHRGRNALQVPAPDVSDREHSRQAGLEQERHPGQGPVRQREILLSQIRAGLDEAF